MNSKSVRYDTPRLTRYEIFKLHNEGKIERMKNGYYMLANEDKSKVEIISSLYQGIGNVSSSVYSPKRSNSI